MPGKLVVRQAAGETVRKALSEAVHKAAGKVVSVTVWCVSENKRFHPLSPLLVVYKVIHGQLDSLKYIHSN